MNFLTVKRPIKSINGCLHILAASAITGGILQIAAIAGAQTQANCPRQSIENQAVSVYQDTSSQGSPDVSSSSNLVINCLSRQLTTINTAGITDSNSNRILRDLTEALMTVLRRDTNLTSEEANKAVMVATQAWAKLPANSSITTIFTAARTAIVAALPNKANLLDSVGTSSKVLSLAKGLKSNKANLSDNIGFSSEQQVSNLAKQVLKQALILAGIPKETAEQMVEMIPLDQSISNGFQSVKSAYPKQIQALNQVQQNLVGELDNLKQEIQTQLISGNELAFAFVLRNTKLTEDDNTGDIDFWIPNPAEEQIKFLTGSGTVTAVKYQVLNAQGDITAQGTVTDSQFIRVAKGGELKVWVMLKLGTVLSAGSGWVVALNNSVTGEVVQQSTVSFTSALTDPFGRITSCTGGTLANYQGFNVGLYEPDANDSTGTGIAGIVPLTGTELPDNPNNQVPRGITPNTQNSNPFNLTNSDQGRYSFLLDKSRGQLSVGKTYILLVNTPSGSNYRGRRVRIKIDGITKQADNSEIVKYTATSLDDLPISILFQPGQSLPTKTDENSTKTGEIASFVETGEIVIENAEAQGLSLAVVSLFTSVCEASELQIVKTGDRAAAEPGDTVIYRLSIRNLSNTNINNLEITDNLPLGFKFLPESVRASLPISGKTNPVAITSSQNDSNINFKVAETLSKGSVLTIAYAVVLTPDAVRGTGQNIANVKGKRTDNNLPVKDGPTMFQLRIRPGILSNTGTILGRVFVDKNFDGEQQANEPGIPNAVIFMDDGNKITTDPNGLFSVANVLPGSRSGVLDLSSLPGYTLAPNLYIKERNSQSRLVHLAPGGMVRMNFGVTPTFKGEKP
ncbi:conserved repeat domain protein [Crinalium epipsammum PCC 9333]|uniref:Conserved repeat domain protein n=1 Tax=Crinalium epipsammum PCC 9333 TaxID=1173022 RepID=K9VWR0_9CYAN|nr:DUF11 domain-containing protein [Crinalium epipsammum]AFZ11999.1 conserved repeat domain protein [Crinalium epipsammum PCC 9333]